MKLKVVMVICEAVQTSRGSDWKVISTEDQGFIDASVELTEDYIDMTRIVQELCRTRSLSVQGFYIDWFLDKFIIGFTSNGEPVYHLYEVE